MKKNYTKVAFAIMLLSSALASAQISTFPWNETFEDNSPTRAGWTQITMVNNMLWTYATTPSTGGTQGGAGSNAAYQGTKMANYPGTSHNFDRTKLVSPVLDLSGISNPTLNFYYRNPYWNPDQNWLRIFYRTNSGEPWIQIVEFHTNVPSWAPSGNIVLPNPSATYQIALDCETDYGYSTVVDALVVDGTALAVNEFTKGLISYFPNPTENILNFNSSKMISNITVINLLGQVVMERNVNAAEGQIDLSTLTAGTYIVRGTTEAGTEIFKVTKK